MFKDISPNVGVAIPTGSVTLPLGNISATGPLTVNSPSPIQGKMVTVSKAFSGIHLEQNNFLGTDELQIKKILCELLVEKIMKEKLVEFTSQQNPMDYTTVFRARIFVTPDDQVRLLRKMNV